jgi:hypothetical protein
LAFIKSSLTGVIHSIVANAAPMNDNKHEYSLTEIEK